MPDTAHDCLTRRRQQCVTLAKRLIVDSVWKNANIETNVTFPDTQAIFENLTIKGLRTDQIVTVNNIKHAWMWLVDNAERYVDWSIVPVYNRLVGAGIVDNAGQLRAYDVRIAGVKWRPQIPTFMSAQAAVGQVIVEESDPEKRALRLFLTICRGQFFADGNKRTATMVANHCLVNEGVGIFALDPELKPRLTTLLTHFYETGEEDEILDFLADNAVEHLPGGLTAKEQRQALTRSDPSR